MLCTQKMEGLRGVGHNMCRLSSPFFWTPITNTERSLLDDKGNVCFRYSWAGWSLSRFFFTDSLVFSQGSLRNSKHFLQKYIRNKTMTTLYSCYLTNVYKSWLPKIVFSCKINVKFCLLSAFLCSLSRCWRRLDCCPGQREVTSYEILFEVTLGVINNSKSSLGRLTCSTISAQHVAIVRSLSPSVFFFFFF